MAGRLSTAGATVLLVSPRHDAQVTSMMLTISFRRLRYSVTLGALTLAGAACSSPSPPASQPPAPISAQPPQALALWGDMKPVVSVKELMKYSIDPISDNIFDAIGSVVTKKGIEDRTPKTDEDWEKIQIGAVTLAETAYLLKVPREFTPPGDKNNSEGPDAVELSPEAIKAKVLRDPVEWNARIETLRNAALAVMEIVKKRDAAAMWDASENLDTACENCHRSYWYPGEDAAFYEKLRKRLDDYSKTAQGSPAAPRKK
jgi:cytochrome c556